MHQTQVFDSKRLKHLHVPLHAIKASAVSVFWFMDMLCCSTAERYVMVIAGKQLVLSPVTRQSVKGRLHGGRHAAAHGMLQNLVKAG